MYSTNQIVQASRESVNTAELGWTGELVGYNKLFILLVTICLGVYGHRSLFCAGLGPLK
jgi:hypothetical protein